MINVSGVSIEIERGDITDCDVDAIVNAANNHFWMGAGVAGAIKKKGGEAIEIEATTQGPVDVGGSVITTGGALKARHVIHAAGMGQDLHTDVDKVAAATASSLDLAIESGLESVAYPAIGTGVGGLSLEAAAKAMIDAAVNRLLEEHGNLKRLCFVLFDEAGYDAYRAYLTQKFTA